MSNGSTPSVQQQATGLLAGLPFGNLIGGPLTAAIQAQGQAAMTTVQFIEAVGFVPQSGSGPNSAVQNVTFSYTKADPTTNPPSTMDMELTVPLLTIVPIPFIRISNMTISFTANIQADTSYTETTATSQAFTGSVSGSFGGGWFFPSVNFSASYSNTSSTNTTSNSTYNVQYQMQVTVNAAQDDMPGGLQTILNTLLNSVQAVPAKKTGT